MAGVNKAIILGRLGRDPEVRTFQNGGRVVNLRVATSETWKDRDGERQERTEWHSVAIFNEPLGELAEKYLRKGDEVYLEGQIETRKWEDKDGNERYATEIVLRPYNSRVVLIGGNRNRDRGDREERQESGRERRQERQDDSRGRWDSGGRSRKADLDDDIPF